MNCAKFFGIAVCCLLATASLAKSFRTLSVGKRPTPLQAVREGCLIIRIDFKATYAIRISFREQPIRDVFYHSSNYLC